jgi:hypothetical protein
LNSSPPIEQFNGANSRIAREERGTHARAGNGEGSGTPKYLRQNIHVLYAFLCYKAGFFKNKFACRIPNLIRSAMLHKILNMVQHI